MKLLNDNSVAKLWGGGGGIAKDRNSEYSPKLVTVQKRIKFHLCPGLHAAAKFAIFRVLAKNRRSGKVNEFLRSLAIFRSC